MVENSTRENWYLFTPGATATWETKDFIHEVLLGGSVDQIWWWEMEIAKEVVESMLAPGDRKPNSQTSLPTCNASTGERARGSNHVGA
ncbi:hypothetical protein MAA_10284 [Metarhizium robertsii ARSEF 23]|uniref:Uncharacterized protein n=1 Tax=Metarhizium robertsii (strain ARSEF 23 / ATCC MYA-3075) TaxID=655844 RepID=E9FDD5_METRA|nr:uncharacterized protein MAA_10284 [Metarhizium robertsii ARSEF 23]EFY94249.1 hypothetical protein MAA_10284 [Metarhizium robertsii ARSEF 23]